MSSEDWGTWECPYEGCEDTPNDPDYIRVTSCGNGHSVLLGPVQDNGFRWAEKYVPTQADITASILLAKATFAGEGGINAK